MKIKDIIINDPTGLRKTADLDNEKISAIADLKRESFIAVPDLSGPYTLEIRFTASKVLIDVFCETSSKKRLAEFYITPLRSLIRDYLIIKESYNDAVRSGNPARIEAIDMGRRGLHNEAAEVLRELLAPNMETDFETTRRLFSLLAAAHMR